MAAGGNDCGATGVSVFFARERAFDRARMYREAECRFDLARKPPSAHRALALEALRDEGHHLGGELVRALGPALSRKKAAQARPGEGCFGLIEGGTRHPEERRGLGLGGALPAHLAQHLVLHLHRIARVEESAALEPGGAHPLRVGIEGAELLQTLGFGIALGQ